ncbi:hypothetical protein [truncated ORF], partial [Penicillium rubens Wisconsin 54-1255]
MEYGNDSDHILPYRIGKRSSVSRRSRERAQKLPLDPGKVSSTDIKEGASKILRRSPYKRPSESSGTTRSFTTTARDSIKPVDTKPRRISLIFRNTKVTRSGKVDINKIAARKQLGVFDKFPPPLSSPKALGGIGGDSDSDSNSGVAGGNSGAASGD